MDASMKCSWKGAWLKLEPKIVLFNLADVFKKINKPGFAKCVLCQKEISYGR